MKKIFLGFIIIPFLFIGKIFAESPPLLSATFVEVDNGKIADNTLLASDDSSLFIEFSKESRFVLAEEKTNFTGEILPPQIIELDIQNPRNLLRELVTFELVASTGTDIAFIDEYDARTRKDLYRENLKNPQSLNRSSWVKLIFPIDVNLANLPKLWEWQGEENGWKRIGGTLQDIENSTKENKDIKVFNTILRRTGIYTIFDEDPPPLHFADEYELHPPNYIEPVAEKTKFIDDLGFAQDSYKEENVDENSAKFEPESREEEIPNTDKSELTQSLENLQTKITQNPAKLKENPKMKKKINELVNILNQKIKTEEEIKKINSKLNIVSKSLGQAKTAEEKTNIEKTFLELQTQLYKLNDEAPDEDVKFISLTQEVDDFFAGITLSETVNENEVDYLQPDEELDMGMLQEPKNEEIYIPENTELPKSGANDEQNISWAFPIFLLFCFGLLGFGIFAGKKDY